MAQSILCSADYIDNYLYFNFSSQCGVVEKACPGQDGYIFLKLYYCYMNHSALMLLILTAIIVFIAFNLLSSTAENYLSPAVTNISEKLGLSETVAGVTLVAMGNGAPDCLVAISAASGGGSSDDEGDGISFTIGSIFGAGLFVCTMCVSLVIAKAGGNLQPNKILFTRDLFFYFLAATCILVYGIIGKITFTMALGFMGIYVIYIVVVIILEMKTKKGDDEKEMQERSKTEDGLNIQVRGYSIQNEQEIKGLKQNLLNEINQDKTNQLEEIDESNETDINQKQQSINDNSSDDSVRESNLVQKPSKPFQLDIKENHYQTDLVQSDNGDNSEEMNGFKKRQKFLRTRHQIRMKMLNAKLQWKELEFMDKVTYIWEIPADFIRDITIPPAEETWNKYRAIISVILGLPFFMVSGILPEDLIDPAEDWYILAAAAGLGAVFGIFTWKLTHSSKAPSFCWIYSTLAFLISIAWINLIADYLIEFLSFIQIITQINQVFLGMTFLAIGNSLADYYTNGQLSQMGFGNMAITACYSGQLFNLLVGFGLSLIISTIKAPIDFDLFGQKAQGLDFSAKIGNSLGYILVIFSIFNVLFLIIYSFSTQFKYGKRLIGLLRLIYIVLILGCMVVGIISDVTAPEFQSQ